MPIFSFIGYTLTELFRKLTINDKFINKRVLLYMHQKMCREGKLFDQVYSNTRLPTQVNTTQHESDTSQHESTWVNTCPTQVNTSPTRVNTNQHESDTSQQESKTSQHESDTSQHESTQVKSVLDELTWVITSPTLL